MVRLAAHTSYSPERTAPTPRSRRRSHTEPHTELACNGGTSNRRSCLPARTSRGGAMLLIREIMCCKPGMVEHGRREIYKLEA
jgi:hypothetical protein